MEAKHSWWQKIIQHRVIILSVAIILIVAIKLIIVGYRFDWTGFNGNSKSGKTLWDWLQLLFIPLSLAVIAILFNRSERKNEQQVASDNQQETALQEYIKEMSELLLHERLRESQPEDEVRKVARAKTLTVLSTLDANRKRNLLQFLFESQLINVDHSIINLRRADMSYVEMNTTYLSKGHKNVATKYMGSFQLADLSGVVFIGANLESVSFNNARLRDANLKSANLRQTYLQNADLQQAFLLEADLRYAFLDRANMRNAFLYNANLSEATLTEATLIEANLSGANLSGVDLSGANLSNAILEKANLSGADLSGATVTLEQLSTAKSLKGATMPDRSIHP